LARDPSNRVALSTAVDHVRTLSERLDGYCRQLGRDPGTIRRSVLAHWASPDPLVSVQAFDEYVGAYGDIGIDELVFYWPPLDNIQTGLPVSSEQRARVERIAAARIDRPA
jgi:hypothetical protein